MDWKIKASATRDKEEVEAKARHSFRTAAQIQSDARHLIRSKEFCDAVTNSYPRDFEIRENIKKDFDVKSAALLAVDPEYQESIALEKNLVNQLLDIADKNHHNIVKACEMARALGTFDPLMDYSI